jgi:hypothetical protein
MVKAETVCDLVESQKKVWPSGVPEKGKGLLVTP